MFHVLNLTYTQPIEIVDKVRPAHIEWIEQQIAAGRMLLAGRKESATGGVLITTDLPTEEVDAMVATDPYRLADVAEYERIGFAANLRAPGL
ncbi:GTP cyclohydrolase II [Mycolicibacterium insubricum]|uniref:GTP cyclohydrolase n=1 Tax=Mycolicibacterium insubricum TaxID=444597 RepID=A0A1X0DKE8_9MYCO|nr:YciI family protein [Mycolicibacterium insubricum]MCB9440071.1 GTP cyclohydrolase [Mycolicibacterium sp.]MCV7081755.1 GTP cyclohydrolase [Mycolicibacterium insubricum]ORA72815.1 GTP cyclohydrolase [Mycolicibacterium insubricum]BBZ66499.1 GTP cyclohydrolase II [Mycolicibacterium insubricum]